VINSHKVPASGEVVNDGRQTALSHRNNSRFGARASGPASGPAEAEYCPGSMKIPTKPRFFSVYQKWVADITIAGTATEQLKSSLPKNWLVATTTMRTMIPLRVFGILANIVLFATAIPAHNYLVMLVQSAMFCVNSYRLHQMLQLVRDVKNSINSDLSMEWLKPFMTERQCPDAAQPGPILLCMGLFSRFCVQAPAGRRRSGITRSVRSSRPPPCRPAAAGDA
jgi:hypothetical protein